MSSQSDEQNEKHTVTLPGVVEKIVKPVVPSDAEKAQIVVEGADPLYKELRIENELESENGEKLKLKRGAKVEVTIEATTDGVEKKGA